MAAPVDVSWVAHPDIVTSAIKLLAGAVFALGSSLVATLLYIWHQTKGKIDSIDLKVNSIAISLSELAGKMSKDIAEINIRCEERHSNHNRRITDNGE